MLNPIAWLIVKLLEIYSWVVIASVVMSWLIAGNVINLQNQFVRSAVHIMDVLTEPVFRQVRRIIPAISGIDLSPLVVLFAIWFLQYSVYWISLRVAF